MAFPRRHRGRRLAAWVSAAVGWAVSLAAVCPPVLAQIPDDAPSDTPHSETGAEAAQHGPEGERPTAARRTVAFFDFEEPDNPYPVPEHWFRAQEVPADGRDAPPTWPRPGFPEFNRAEFSPARAVSGVRSVMLPVRSGSCSLRLEPGTVPVFAGADYSVSAMIHTENARCSRARLCARLLDASRRPIDGAEFTSAPIASPDGWTDVMVEVPGEFPGAVFLQIDLEMLQPHQFMPHGELGEHTIWHEDLDADAFFDDVRIQLIPRLELGLAPESRAQLSKGRTAATVVMAPKTPKVVAKIRDLVGDDLWAELIVRDFDRRIVSSMKQRAPSAGTPIEFTPELPGFGWYECELRLSSGGRYVSGLTTAWAWLPAEMPMNQASAAAAYSSIGSPMGLARMSPGRNAARLRDRSRFGVGADAWDIDMLESLPEMLEPLGSGFVYVSAWDRDTTPEGDASAAARAERLAGVLDALLARLNDVTLCLPGVPTDIAVRNQVSPDNPLALAASAEAEWIGHLMPLLDEYGLRVRRWQIGQIGSAAARAVEDPVAAAGQLGGALARLVPGIETSLSWRGEWPVPSITQGREKESASPRACTLSIPAGFAPEAIGTLVDDWAATLAPPPSAPPASSTKDSRSGDRPVEATVVLETLPTTPFGARAAVADMLQRAVETWAAASKLEGVRAASDNADEAAGGGAPAAPTPPGALALRLGIAPPWGRSPHQRRQVEPGPMYPAFRNVVDRLAGRRIVGEYPAPAGVKCYIVATVDTTGAIGSSLVLSDGALVAWNRSCPADEAFISGYLGDGKLWRVDHAGNAAPIAVNARLGSVEPIPVDAMPIFIEGIDPYVALFMAGFRIEPTFVPAVSAEHVHTMRLRNPWPFRVSGLLQIRRGEDEEDEPQGAAGGGGGGIGAAPSWVMQPRGVLEFAIDAGQTASIPLVLSFGPADEAGPKDVAVITRLQTDHPLPPIRLGGKLELGLEELDLSPEYALSPGADGSMDLIVIAAITNKSDKPRSLRIEALARGYASQTQQVSSLGPGQTILRRFLFEDGGTKLSGKRVVLGLSDADGPQRITRTVKVP